MSTGQNRELPSFLVASVSLFALAGGHWIQLDSDPTCRSSHRRFLCAGSHATCRCHRAQVPDGNVISLTCLPSAVHRGSCKRSLRVIDAAADAAQRLRNEQHGHFQYAQGRAPQQFLHALRNLSCELPHSVQCACAADKPMLTPTFGQYGQLTQIRLAMLAMRVCMPLACPLVKHPSPPDACIK